MKMNMKKLQRYGKKYGKYGKQLYKKYGKSFGKKKKGNKLVMILLPLLALAGVALAKILVNNEMDDDYYDDEDDFLDF